MMNNKTHNQHYNFLQAKFTEWLKTENYKLMTTIAYPQATGEFFDYLNKQQVLHIHKATQEHLTSFKNHLQTRPNKKTLSGGIKNMTINGIIKGINCFVRHLNSTSEGFKLDMYEDYLPVTTTEKIILNPTEVMELYHATFEPYPFGSIEMGQRDRVMIAIFYGCGLRLNEGRNLNLSDIDFQNKQIHVREGKGSKERFVAIPNKHLADIQSYIQQGREWFKYHHYNSTCIHTPVQKQVPKVDEDALFLSIKGRRLLSFGQRLEFLSKHTTIQKKIGTHTLRHSLATHLLSSGWKLEQVSKLLGHASIDSTQIYVHLAEQLTHEKYEE